MGEASRSLVCRACADKRLLLLVLGAERLQLATSYDHRFLGTYIVYATTMAATDKLSVDGLCDWLTEQLRDDIGAESVEVLRKNKVATPVSLYG